MRLGWVDFDESALSQAKEIMLALEQPGARDYLGLGVVRDRVSDYLFPGTSVLMRGAGYFFLVPRAIRKLQKENMKTSISLEQLGNKLYEIEKYQAIELQKKFPELSFIGSSNLKRSKQSKFVEILPSDAYWVGLQTFKIIPTNVTKNRFMRQLAIDQESGISWCDIPNLDGKSLTTLDLSGNEANYLSSKIMQIESNMKEHTIPPLLSCLPQNLEPYKLEGKINFPWEISREGLNIEDDEWKHYRLFLNEAKVISHLICISYQAYGFHVSRLSEYSSQSEALEAQDLFNKCYDTYREEAINGKIIEKNFPVLHSIYSDPKFKSGMTFIKSIGDLLISSSSKRVFLNKTLPIITAQELKSKKNHARLTPVRQIDSETSLRSNDWKGSEMPNLLDFRWHTVRRILHDISKAKNG